MIKNILNSRSGSVKAIILVCSSAFIFSSCFKEVDVNQIPQPNGIIQVSPAAGPKNTILSISGNNFPDKANIVVKVNGKTVPILASTSNNIQAQIPAGTGSGNIEVTYNGTTYTGPTFEYQNTYTVSSLTNGQVGHVDGPLSTAKLEDVESVAIDGNDNLYVGNYYGAYLRQINLNTATVSTLAAQNGGAEFVATDAAGNVYYVDEDNNELIKVTPAGVTSTIASPSFGIQGVKVGASGNIYVSGRTNIVKYSPAGTLLWRLTSHGSGDLDGDTSTVKFALYGNIDVDASETKIYVINNSLGSGYPSKIKMLDLSAKTMKTVAGSSTGGYADGAASEAQFTLAYGVTLDNQGGLYIADNGNSAIRYLKGGVVKTVIGGNGAGDLDGIGTAAKISGPQNVGFDSKGNMYIADFGNTKIYKVVID